MSPFPQSVAVSSMSPAVFPSPLGIIQVAFVHLGAPNFSNGHAGSVDKVS